MIYSSLSFFTLSNPIWLGDLGSESKNLFLNLTLMVFGRNFFFSTHATCSVKN
jgi:hypothetical protein